MGVNSRRKVYSVLRGAFSADGIMEYIRDMTGGRGRTTKLRGDTLPAINTVEAWDGQDGQVGWWLGGAGFVLRGSVALRGLGVSWGVGSELGVGVSQAGGWVQVRGLGVSWGLV